MYQLKLTDKEMMDHCSFDGLCLIRTLTMGRKVCLCGMVNAVWLFPLYSWAPKADNTQDVTDGIVKLTVSHLPNESPRFVGTVVAAYLLFLYLMYLIYTEFQWFIGTYKIEEEAMG